MRLIPLFATMPTPLPDSPGSSNAPLDLTGSDDFHLLIKHLRKGRDITHLPDESEVRLIRHMLNKQDVTALSGEEVKALTVPKVKEEEEVEIYEPNLLNLLFHTAVRVNSALQSDARGSTETDRKASTG